MNDTLEYSTKILEYGNAGCAAVLNRNPLHEELLGEQDYPLFANTLQEFIRAVEAALVDDALAQTAADRLLAIAREHVLSRRVGELRAWLKQVPSRNEGWEMRDNGKVRVLLAGHDLKFFTPLQRRLEETGHFEFMIDRWQGHNQHDPVRSRELLGQADVVVCEWCLGNVIWYSRHKLPSQRLFVRFHAQELKTNYLKDAEWEAIDVLAFVAPHIQRKFEARYPNFPSDVQAVIPNFVESRTFKSKEKQGDAQFTLGLLGYAPKLKRLDRAVDLLERLLACDARFKLRVKGRNPFEYSWIRTRNEEQAYYESLFERINSDVELRHRVIFDPHGDDVNEWFRLVGHVLSPSDRESFHFAVAEGALTGCNPVVWQREGVEDLWPTQFVCTDTEAATLAVVGATKKMTNFRSTIEQDYTESVVRDWRRCLMNPASSGKIQALSRS